MTPGRDTALETNEDPFYCKQCRNDSRIRIPLAYTGDALIVCSRCGREHCRQFAAGIAISCDPPTGRPIRIRSSDGRTRTTEMPEQMRHNARELYGKPRP